MSPRDKVKTWFLTYPQNDTEPLELLEKLQEIDKIDKYVIAQEKHKDGNNHLHAYIKYKDGVAPGKNFINAHKVFDVIGKRGNIQPARSPKNVINYCAKGSSYISNFDVQAALDKKATVTTADLIKYDAVDALEKGLISVHSMRNYQYAHKLAKEKLRSKPKTVKCFPLRGWQADLNERLNRTPDPRKIIFIVDLEGNQGKSWFCHYHRQNHEEKTQVIIPGKKADMAHTIDEDKKVFFFDSPRSKQGEYIQYDFIEELKNGYILSPKYDSRMKSLDTPHVVVMTNETPDMAKLSSDRYLIYHLHSDGTFDITGNDS